MKWTVEVEITNIDVGSKYYSFDYSVNVNGKLHDSGEYESDHAWKDLKAFKELLEGGSAAQTILQMISI